MLHKKLKKLFVRKSSQKGFTLIELLVVIGILGILASALIATIDPFEQLKKADDANVKNAAVEFINANIRYYTTHNQMPWQVDANCSLLGAGTTFAGVEIAVSSGPTSSTIPATVLGCLTSLASDGEIKSAFTTATGVLSSIYISGTTNSLTACFKPGSKSQQRDPNTHFASDGSTVASGCLSQSGTNSCFWCSQ